MTNLLLIVFVVLLTLKLTAVVTFSWFFVFLPLITIVVLNVIFLLIVVSTISGSRKKVRKDSWW